MNVIIIIVKKNPLTEIYRKGDCQTTKKQENDAAKETSCSYVTKKKDTYKTRIFMYV